MQPLLDRELLVTSLGHDRGPTTQKAAGFRIDPATPELIEATNPEGMARESIEHRPGQRRAHEKCGPEARPQFGDELLGSDGVQHVRPVPFSRVDARGQKEGSPRLPDKGALTQ